MDQIFILLVAINRSLLRSKSQKIQFIDATSHGVIVMKQGLHGTLLGMIELAARSIAHCPFNLFFILAPAVQSIGRIFHNENYPSGVTHLDVY